MATGEPKYLFRIINVLHDELVSTQDGDRF
jgi:hypothetical protein